MNKKGSLQDLVYFIMILLVFAIVVLIGLNIAGQFKTNLNSMSSSVVDTTTKEQVSLTVAKGTGALNNSFLFLLIFMCIAILVLAAMVAVHPIFIVVFFLGWIFTIFLGAIFSNIYQNMALETSLASTAAQLGFVSNVMNYLPFIVGILGIILMIVMYKVSNQ